MSEQAVDKPAEKKSAGEMMIQYFRDFGVLKETRKEYWGIQVVNFLDCTFYFAMLTIASLFLSHDLGMTDENAGKTIAVFTSATTILLTVSGRRGNGRFRRDRISHRWRQKTRIGENR